MTTIAYDAALEQAGVGTFQKKLFATFALVWAADAMQVLAIGFTIPSLVASFGVSVPEALQTGTLFFAGMLVGAFAFGRLADRIGRRNVLVVTVLIDAIFGIASAFAPDFGWLLALRFLTGLGVGGTLPIDYTMMAEFLPAERRGRWLVALEGSWAVGTIIVAIGALAAATLYPDAPWRAIFLITGIPALIGVLIRFWIPESPLYLLRRGRAEEARAILVTVAEANGCDTAIPELAATRHERRPLSALLSPQYRRRTILVLAAWLLVSASYYGVFVWLPIQLAKDGLGFLRGHLFLILVALAQLPGYALAAYGVDRWGRKPTLIGFLVLSAIGCFAYGLGQSAALVTITTLVMSFALLGTWGALYAFTAGNLPDRPARDGNGDRWRHGPPRRPPGALADGADHGRELHRRAHALRGPSGGCRRRHLCRRHRNPQAGAGVAVWSTTRIKRRAPSQHPSRLRRSTRGHPHDDGEEEGEVGELVGHLVEAEGGPEALFVGRPAAGRSPLDAIDRCMDQEIDDAEPPERRCEDERDQQRQHGMDAGMGQERLQPVLRLGLALRHPGELQRVVGQNVLDREGEIDGNKRGKGDRHRRAAGNAVIGSAAFGSVRSF